MNQCPQCGAYISSLSSGHVCFAQTANAWTVPIAPDLQPQILAELQAIRTLLQRILVQGVK